MKSLKHWNYLKVISKEQPKHFSTSLLMQIYLKWDLYNGINMQASHTKGDEMQCTF